MINSLGDVRWCDPETMLRSNYLACQKDATLWIKPYSCRVELAVPPGITTVAIALPEKKEPAVTLEYAITRKRGRESQMVRAAAGVPVEVAPGDAVEMVLSNWGTMNYREVEKPGLSLRALSRRVFCEGRDRLVPLVPKLRRV